MTTYPRRYGGRSLLLLLLWCIASVVEAQSVAGLLTQIPNCAVSRLPQRQVPSCSLLDSVVAFCTCMPLHSRHGALSNILRSEWSTVGLTSHVCLR